MELLEAKQKEYQKRLDAIQVEVDEMNYVEEHHYKENTVDVWICRLFDAERALQLLEELVKMKQLDQAIVDLLGGGGIQCYVVTRSA